MKGTDWKFQPRGLLWNCPVHQNKETLKMWDQHWSLLRLRSNLNLQTRFISLLEMEPATSSIVNPAQTQRKGGGLPGDRMEEVTAALSRGLPTPCALWLLCYSATDERKLWVGSINVSSVLVLSGFTSHFTLICMSWRGKRLQSRQAFQNFLFSINKTKTKNSSWFCVFFCC